MKSLWYYKKALLLTFVVVLVSLSWHLFLASETKDPEPLNTPTLNTVIPALETETEEMETKSPIGSSPEIVPVPTQEFDIELKTDDVKTAEEPLTLSDQPIFSGAMLSAHNTERAKKGVPPLIWSDKLAASAKSWANKLQSRDCTIEHSSGPYGENLYYSWTSGDLSLNPISAAASWIAEEQYYDYDSDTCLSGKVCGHYTQVVWSDSRELGCGVSTCALSGKNTQVWVCQYSPAGNIIGQKPY